MPRKIIDKPFADGTLSNAAFFGMIRAALRQKSRWWKPISLCKQAAKRKYTGPNKRQKVEFLCAKCNKYFSDKNVQVHHKIHAGTLTCFEDLPAFVKNLFCNRADLEVLCVECHKKEHKNEPKQKT